jgi:hypothetical protein
MTSGLITVVGVSFATALGYVGTVRIEQHGSPLSYFKFPAIRCPLHKAIHHLPCANL